MKNSIQTDLSEYLRNSELPYLCVRTSLRTMVVGHEYGGPGIVVRKLRGKKCMNLDGFMDELGAALQFLYGFGENWSAVAELLRYLDEWMPGDGYVLVFEHADSMFPDNPEELLTLIRILDGVVEWWSAPITDNGRYNRPARPFQVVLECSNRDFVDTVMSIREAVCIQ